MFTFYRFRLTLRRISNPLRIEVQEMRCLDISLNNQYWFALDRCMDGLSIHRSLCDTRTGEQYAKAVSHTRRLEMGKVLERLIH